MKRKIYFAGGWFSPEQEEEHTRIFKVLNEYYDVFNPRTASFVGPDATKFDMEATLMGNINAIKEADIVVAITDRKDVGTIWETGFAYAIKKPIIYYAETLGNKPFNLMLAKTGMVARNEIQLLFELDKPSSWVFSEIRNDYNGEVE